MKTATEFQLRKAALALTAIVGLQVVWNGVSLLLLSEPEAILPASASLNVDGVSQGSGDEGAPEGLATRPLFWNGRAAHVPQEGGAVVEAPMDLKRNTEIDKVELLGVYAGGAATGVIVAYKGERRRLQVSDSLEGWELVRLTEKGAEFHSRGEKKELLLKHASAATAAKKDVSRRRITRAEARQLKAAKDHDSSGQGSSKKKASGDSKNKEKSSDKSKKEKGKKEKKNGSSSQDKSAGNDNDNTGE
ncbi:MAG: hypothetical protein ACI9JM_002166 [Halioglobus sp.]|jgi:hypothetical protein